MNKEKKIKILQDVIQIETVNDNEVAVAEYFKDLFNEYEIESKLVEYSPMRANLVAEIKGEKPGKVLIFNGHSDVVAAGDPEDWTHPPFAGVIEDGKLYGRGATDMKAGLTALALAMIEIKEQDLLKAGTIRFIITVGEEIGMYGSKQMTEEGYVDDADAIIVGEPKMGDGKIVTAHKGSVQYEIVSYGRSAHSSMPELGINSIQQIVDFIPVANEKIAEAASKGENEKLGRMLNAFTIIDGGDQINSIPAITKLKGNGRTVPEVDNEMFLDALNASIDEINNQIEGRLELNIMQNNPAVESDFDTDLIQSFRNVANVEIEPVGMTGATDASNFGRIEKDFDLAIYGPGVMEVAHQVDEYVEIDDYLNFIDLYQKVAQDYLNN
ncbi:ArgE/DapE family deacylase [Dolosicoccus paucivorans]|uniref:Probable succinyl-diaminopimelate desuccinylase n=1 Tax=Dolosicoccus paucivorans TaxID=84521 RepID=A0A2N6SLB4_9LACT|nr:ArgE/DapE family deacylase [Dolosicoccus paucivorans]PMB83747.1 succinyl-diaminopimelate desuccinylase [Dolosicoccus paucivorans]PMC57855.1 succinyl-diaminopimelate desuccinylase [Dolosicoccus paucivorans]